MSPSPSLPVIVVGAGISGIAAARAMADAGLPVRVLDRGRRAGGRMAVRTEHIDRSPRPVDIGAAYLTARGEQFSRVVAGWQAEDLIRPWTDTLALASPAGLTGTTSGPQRWAAPGGLRSLVEHLAQGLDVTSATNVEIVGLGDDGRPHVDGRSVAAVVLAMPDPQAADLLPDAVARRLGIADSDYAPVISIWAAWTPPAWWPPFDAAFVDGSALVATIADDGARRGDGAAVLVVHTTGTFAAAHLDDPGGAVEPVLAELPALLGVNAAPEPEFVRAHRWSLAAPRRPHAESFGLLDLSGTLRPDEPATGLIGVCGDAWGPAPRIEQAWLSGHRLGSELAVRLAARGERSGPG